MDFEIPEGLVRYLAELDADKTKSVGSSRPFSRPVSPSYVQSRGESAVGAPMRAAATTPTISPGS